MIDADPNVAYVDKRIGTGVLLHHNYIKRFKACDWLFITISICSLFKFNPSNLEKIEFVPDWKYFSTGWRQTL